MHDVLRKDKSLIGALQIEALIASSSVESKRVGANMGAMLISKYPFLELTDLVTSEYSMEKITQTLVRNILDY